MNLLFRSISIKGILTVVVHIFSWALFIFYPVFLFNIQFQNTSFFFRLVIHGIILAGIFYLNMYYLIPKFYATKKYISYFLMALMTILIVFTEEAIATKYFFHGRYNKPFRIENLGMLRNDGFSDSNFQDDSLLRNPPTKSQQPSFKRETFKEDKFKPRRFGFIFNPRTIGKALSSSIIVLAVSGFFRMAKDWAFLDQQRRELEKSKLNSELTLLKSQVNPHFLFNSLNSIYSLAHKKSDYTETAIVKLSQLMRYMIYDVTEDFVTLGSEVKYLLNYVELQKLRLSEKMSVKIDVDEKLVDSKIQIAPMLLIVLVENVFKYGVSYANPSEIYLKLEVNSNEIDFLTVNQIKPQSENYDNKGMGLVNLTKRLQLIYPEKHEFTIRNENNEYAANLKIKI